MATGVAVRAVTARRAACSETEKKEEILMIDDDDDDDDDSPLAKKAKEIVTLFCVPLVLLGALFFLPSSF